MAQLRTEGRTPLNMPWPEQLALQKAKHEARLDDVETLLSMGYSQVKIAQALGISRKTVYRAVAEIRARRKLENAAIPAERVDESLMKQQRLYQQLQEVLNDKRAYAKDKVAAASAALQVLRKIDDLRGTWSPEKVIVAAAEEMLDVFMEIVSQATPEQKQLYLHLLQLRLRRTRMGERQESAGAVVPEYHNQAKR